VDFEGQSVTFFHLIPIEPKLTRRPSSRQMIPSVGK
jgi:hypothetical protein